MPILVGSPICHMSQEEFGKSAYDVMEQAFAVHNEMGRFFDEMIYQNAVAGRIRNSQTEVCIEVKFEDFRHKYFIDLLVGCGAVFELKTVRTLTKLHKSQLLNYLFLTELSHGKLLNFRPDLIEHEFVNTHLKLSDRTAFSVVERDWLEPGPSYRPLQPWIVQFLRDVGAGLDVQLYEAAVAHRLGLEEAGTQDIEIVSGTRILGRQKVRMANPGWCFKVTAIDTVDLSRFEDHAHRFLGHTKLAGLHWINITRDQVAFTSISRQ
jgi:GxxExxY protein